MIQIRAQILQMSEPDLADGLDLLDPRDPAHQTLRVFLIDRLIQLNPKAAIATLGNPIISDQLPGSWDQQEHLKQLAAINPIAAAEWTETLPLGGSRTQLLNDILPSLRKKDPAAADALAARQDL